MTLDGKAIERAITETLLPAGFTKRGRRWYLSGPECIGVVDLDRSPVVGAYTILLGASPRALQPEGFPKGANYCHIYGSVGSLVGHDRWAIETLWPGVSGESDEAWRRKLADVLRDEVVPFLRSLQTLEGMRRRIEDHTLDNLLVTLKLKRLLQIPTETDLRTSTE